MATSPLVWMRAVRDHVPKPSTVRIAVLWALALRMKQNGAGFASQRQLANDADVDERTVRRHLRWARDGGYLVQMRRGHRLGDGTAIASEYELSQPVTGDLLGTTSTGQTDHLNRTAGGSQPDTGVRPRGLPPEVFPPAARVAATNGKPSATSGGWESHRNEPNARRAIATLVADRRLPFTEDALVLAAYNVGSGDPWCGYLKVKAATDKTFTGVHDPHAVLRKRLGLA